MDTPNTPATIQTAEQRIAGLTQTEFQRKNSENRGRLKIFSLILPGSSETFDVIVRPPTLPEYDAHTSALVELRTKKDKALSATVNLLRQCLIAPSIAEFNALHEAYPAIGDKFGEKLLELTGAEAEVREKTFL